MQAARSLMVLTLAVVLSGASATDTSGTSHAMPTHGRQVPRRESRFSTGWVGVGVNAAILIVKLAVPSLGGHPLSRT